MKFVEYVEFRQQKDFADKLDQLCLNIANSGMEFHEYWTNVALPVLIENDCQNPEQLLQEFDFKRSYINPLNWFGGNQGRSWSGEKKQDPWAAGMNTMGQQKAQAEEQRKAAIEAARQKRLAQVQQGVDTHVSNIKNKFSQAMRMFLKSVSDEALKNNDRMEYSVAKAFYDKMMKVAQPTLDNFSLKASYGKNPHGEEFAGRRGAMQNTMQGDLKSRLANKFPQADGEQQAAAK